MITKLAIRVDVNPYIATGHIMRCISVAQAAKILDVEVVFILADENGVSFLQNYNLPYIILGTNWKDMKSELLILSTIIEQHSIQMLLIDSYQVTEFYLSSLTKITTVVLFGDLQRKDHPADIIIDYICDENFRHQYKKIHSFQTKFLLGTKYAPLRPVFYNLPEKKINNKIDSIVILIGGSDFYHIMSKFAETLTPYSEKIITMIFGKYCTDYHNLKKKYSDLSNYIFLQDVSNIEKYMLEADLAISAGGTTLLELCACGTPTITYTIADNQIGGVKILQNLNLITYIGDTRYDDITQNLIRQIDIFENFEFRRKRSRIMQQQVDGKGAISLVKELLLYD